MVFNFLELSEYKEKDELLKEKIDEGKEDDLLDEILDELNNLKNWDCFVSKENKKISLWDIIESDELTEEIRS